MYCNPENCSTVQGKLEERLPMMSLTFPDAFKREHADLFENLVKNSDRLTTPFDLHETFLHLLDIKKSQSKLRPSRGELRWKQLDMLRYFEACSHECCVRHQSAARDSSGSHLRIRSHRTALVHLSALREPTQDGPGGGQVCADRRRAHQQVSSTDI